MNYYAYSGKGTLEESFDKQVNCTIFKTSNKEIAFKISKRKFGDKPFKLFSFTNFKDINTFTQI
mgnify:FL=1|tara:strand:+ start:5060 stop:5251 length:192 start_codon:yes stop_codon:yes gene_type:complete